MKKREGKSRKTSQLQKVFARNVLLHRNNLGVTQDELADICGYHRTYIGSVERGERNVTLAAVESFANAFTVEPYTLLIPSDE